MAEVVDSNPQEHEAVYRRVVDLMHEAQEAGNDYDTRLTHLRTAKDLILNKSPELIDNFWTEMTSTRHMRSPKAVAYCLDWIRDACAKEPMLVKEKSIFSKEVLLRLMEDPSVVIQKRSLLAVTQIYRNTVKWIAGGGVVEAQADAVWLEVRRVKEHIVAAVSGEEHAENHVGYRLLSYKFLQTVIECQSPREGPAALKDDDPVSSLDIPDKWSGKILSRKLVEAEANSMLDILEGYLTRPTLTTEYVDCISVCGCLFSLAKRRPQYLARVMTAVEFLLSTIPESYTRLHVEGLRKYLKTALIVLLRRCQDPEILERTVQLLTRHFNTSQNEIYRNRANIGEMLRNKKKRETEPEVAAKRQKTEEPDEDEDETEPGAVEREREAPVPLVDYPSLATEINTNAIVPRLTPGVVVQLLLISMRRLPTTMPTQFHATYTPIGSGPASGMLQHLARLLALQMVTADIGPGAEEVAKRKKEDSVRQSAVAAAAENEEPAQPISSILNRVVSETHPADGDGDSGDEGAEPDSVADGMGAAEGPVPSGPVPDEYKATEKAFKLEEMTEAIPPDDRPNALLSILNELLAAEPRALNASAELLFHKCLIHFAVKVGLEPLRERIAAFILEDIGSRAELAFRWIFEEYAHARHIQRTGRRDPKDEEMDGEDPALAAYDACLARFIRGLMEHPEYREGLVSQLYLEVPVVTAGAVALLAEYCTLRSVHGAMRLILKLASSRPHPARYIVPALDLTLSQRKDLQSQAVQTCVKLYATLPLLRPQIQTFAVDCMRLLGQEQVPGWLFTEKYGRTPEKAPEWNEELQRVCSSLFTGILAEDAGLLPVLGAMYVEHPNDVKKTIFKVIDQPVKTIGMNAPEMLQFVKNPPKGSESLVLRIIHLLTETNPPTGELISSIRALYAERIPDVRFLIPILNGLPKEDILAALPKLIKLNPLVVQELFHRLLGTGKHKLDSTQRRPSLSPAEVLIELHKIDISKVDAKSLIKATGLCLEEKELYPAETMVEILRALIDAEPLPFLLMRTVLQTIQLHGARLTPFIMTLLHKLIQRQVWNAPLLWEGFLKCCEKTTPHSYPVLLRLPLERLKGAMDATPALRAQLHKHLTDMTDEQRSYLAPGILELLQVDARHREVRELQEEAPVRNNGEPNVKEVIPNPPREASPSGRKGTSRGSRETSRTAEGSSRSRERGDKERSSTAPSRSKREEDKSGSRKKRERERSRERDGSRRHRHERRERGDDRRKAVDEGVKDSRPKSVEPSESLPGAVQTSANLPDTVETSPDLPDTVEASDTVIETADVSAPVSETTEATEDFPAEGDVVENPPEGMETSEPAQETEDLPGGETYGRDDFQTEDEVPDVSSVVEREEITPQSPEVGGDGAEGPEEVVEDADVLETSADSPEM